MRIEKVAILNSYNYILPDELMILRYNNELVPMVMCKIDETEEILTQIEEIEDPKNTPIDLIRWLIRQNEEGDDIG